MISREPTIERLAVARSLLLEPFGLDRGDAGAGAGDDRDASHRRRRPLLPVHAQRRLEPRGRHRQERQLRHRPGRRRARRRRREDRVRLLRRHLRGRAARRRAHGAHDRRRRAEPTRQGRRRRSSLAAAASSTRRSIRSRTLDSTQKVALLEKVEKLARAKDPRIVQVMAGLAGEYDVVLVARADGTHRRRRAAAGAPVAHRHRRADDRRRGAARVGHRRRRRPLRLRLLPRTTSSRSYVDATPSTPALTNLESRPGAGRR